MSNILKIFDPVSKTWKGVGAIKGDKGETGKSSYDLAKEGGYEGTEQQFKTEQAAVAANSARLTAVEVNKQDKPIAGRSFLTPLFVARGAVFNETTGFYELNGLTDITEAQMIDIYNKTSPPIALPSLVELYNRASFRTNFPYSQKFVGADQVGSVDMRSMFYLCVKTETLNLEKILPYKCNNMFSNCYLLKTIFGEIYMRGASAVNSTGMFSNCRSLSNVSIMQIIDNLSFSDSPLLTRDSILYLINNAVNTKPITVTLHADALARLTEEDIALTSSKNITLTA